MNHADELHELRRERDALRVALSEAVSGLSVIDAARGAAHTDRERAAVAELRRLITQGLAALAEDFRHG